MERDSKLSKLNKHPVIVLLAAVIITFIIFEFVYMPHDYENLGGKHVWVSGSTLKFVNMWLEEGAANLHFTNYEAFPSIEFSSMEDRAPYVSYPTGVTWMVWSAAKICGRNRIDVSFLKHYQMLLYAIENICMALLIYVIVSRLVESASSDDKQSSLITVVLSYIMSLFWMTLPVNNWFMTNIFWTDIAVLFWVIAFWLLEIITDSRYLDERWNKIAIALKTLIVFAGVMTEYFFWIVVFFAFLVNVFRVILKKKENSHWIKSTIVSSLQYIIPVLIAVGMYVWQMSYTENWFDKLLETFLHRTGAENNEASTEVFIENFCQAIVCGSRKKLVLFTVGIITLLAPIIWDIIKKKNVKTFLNDKVISILVQLIILPVLQIAVFSNHSAIHQYAMVKVGFVITGLLIALVYAYGAFQKKKLGIVYCIFVAIIFLISMGYPGQPKKFFYEKDEKRTYDIAESLYENTSYEDVCVSYTYIVGIEPPMDISVSEKCVYEVGSKNDIQELKDSIPSSARLILVIDNNNVGSNDFVDREKSEYIVDQEEMYCEMGEVVYRDDNCTLIDITKMF